MTDYYLITKTSDIQDDKLKLGKSKRNVNLYHGKQRLFFRSGKLKAPFGVQINKFKTDSDFTEYYIDFSVDKNENKDLVDVITTMEGKIKEHLVEQQMFNEDSLDELAPKFNSILKENSGYNPLLKMNIPRKSSGHFDFTVFDKNKEVVHITDANIQDVLFKGVFCKIIFEIDKIWYFKDKYGVTLKVNQIRLCDDKTKELSDNDSNSAEEDIEETELVSKMQNLSYTDALFLD